MHNILVTSVKICVSAYEIKSLFKKKSTGGGGGWGRVAQRRQSCFPPSSPKFESRLWQDFFLLLLSL